jgi:hypothetical protein
VHMVELLAELALRNARLRAWRALGVPVAGAWRPDEHTGGLYRLNLGCAPCRKTRYGTATLLTAVGFADGDERRAAVRAIFAAEEERLARALVSGFARMGRDGRGGWYGVGPIDAYCPHLGPMLGVEPAELATLADLELLAGEAPAKGGPHV